jgi:hypothetical protein
MSYGLGSNSSAHDLLSEDEALSEVFMVFSGLAQSKPEIVLQIKPFPVPSM